MEDKCYLLYVEEFMKSTLIGAYSSMEKAEKQKGRLTKILKRPGVITLATIKIIEVPYDSEKPVDEILKGIKTKLEEELGL